MVARAETTLQREERTENHSGTEQGERLHQGVHQSSSVSKGGWGRLVAALALRAAVRPRLAFDLLTALWTIRSRGWYLHPPFLPIPNGTYLRWRLYTVYGDEHAVPPVEDVVRFVRWRRTFFRP